ncbi:MAG: tRNA uridine-5-carboxymethylaminomethyl(34) synthesis GTPase MnmE [Rhodobacteraceae bacterium]|nr:tRNA uridine-5-carboxymethylaminomethyl(34) synthesis GTPase MnmE [Paracoccaceae bacterium]
MDTIFALSSAKGKAGIAVIRISGPAAREAATRIGGDCPCPRRASLQRLKLSDGSHLDSAIVIYFPAGGSYTGEETMELHVHGGVATVAALHRELAKCDGLRPAEAGEFTLQALLNGKLSLDEVEGLGDLIQAETEAQRRQALKLYSGALSERVEEWRRSLLDCAALIEVTLDFSDEELPPGTLAQAEAAIAEAEDRLQREARGSKIAERIRDGFEVAIVGPPNSGKSTLLNALAGRDAAITSERAGTTRDVIELRMDLGGLPVTLLDTAGLRDAEDPIEKIGVDRARQRASQADLRVFLVQDEDALPTTPERMPGDLVLRAKADLLDPPPKQSVSGKTGFGIAEMTDAIIRELGERSATSLTAAHARHREAINDALAHLSQARAEMRKPGRTEVAAEEIRQAIRALESLVGRIGTEQVLGRIFAGFCIGK